MEHFSPVGGARRQVDGYGRNPALRVVMKASHNIVYSTKYKDRNRFSAPPACLTLQPPDRLAASMTAATATTLASSSTVRRITLCQMTWLSLANTRF